MSRPTRLAHEVASTHLPVERYVLAVLVKLDVRVRFERRLVDVDEAKVALVNTQRAQTNRPAHDIENHRADSHGHARAEGDPLLAFFDPRREVQEQESVLLCGRQRSRPDADAVSPMMKCHLEGVDFELAVRRHR